MDEVNPSTLLFLRTLSSDKRLLVLQWLADPTVHFAPQKDGDLEKDGVCLGAIVRKLGLKQPSVTEHMKILVAANLVQSKSIKTWVFYKLDREACSEALDQLKEVLSVQ